MAKVKEVIFDINFKLGNADARLGTFTKRLDAAQKKLDSAKQGTLEYVQAQKELEQINRELDQSFDNTGKKVSNFEGTIKKAAIGIGSLIAVRSVFDVMRDGVQTIVAFEDELAALSSITGATGGDLEFYAQQAREVGLSSTISAQDAVAAFKLIGSARPQLLESKEALAAVTGEAVILAEAARLDLPVAARALTTVMNQFNLTADQARLAIDGLATGALKGAADIPTLIETIERSGTVLDQNNVTYQEAIALTETLADKQLTGADAGTALRGVILKLTKSGKGFVDGQFNVVAALEQVRGELEQIEDPAQRAEAAIKLFGEEGITAGNILLNNTERITGLVSELQESGTALDQQATNTATLSSAVERLRNAYDDLFLEFKDGTGPAASAIKFIAENLKEIVGALKAGIVAFGVYRAVLLAVALRARILALSQAAAAANTTLFGAATKAATAQVRTFNVATRSNPIGLLIAGLTTAIAFLVDFGDELDVAEEKQTSFNASVQEGRDLLTSFRDLTERIGALPTLSADQLKGLISDIESQIESTNRKLTSVQGFIQTTGAKEATEDYIDLTDRLVAAEQNATDGLSLNYRLRAGGAQEALDIVTITEEGITKTQLEEQLERLKLSLGEANARLGVIRNSAAERAKLNAALLKEQERHELALARVQDKGASDVLAIRDKFARLYLESAEKSTDAEEKDLLRLRNRITEINAEIAKQSNIDRLNDDIGLLREQLTGQVPSETPFGQLLTEYTEKTNELSEAQRRNDDFAEGSIAALQKRAAQLQKLASEADQSAVSFEILKQALIDAQREVNDARNNLKPIDFNALYLADLNEAERHQVAMATIEEEALSKRLELQIAFERARLKLLEEQGKLRTDEAQRIENTLAELEASKLVAKKEEKDEELRLEKEKNLAIVDGVQQVLQASFDAVNTLISIKQAEVDELIGLQRRRVDEARELAKDGNAELLQAEEQRLNELNKKREDFVRRQQVLAAAQLVAESSLAIAKAAAEGGVAAPFTIAATLIALTAGLAQARALASQAAFFKGGYTGDGSPFGVSNAVGPRPYTYHNKEFVMDHVTTGIGNNKEIFQHILDHRINLQEMFKKRVVYVGGGSTEMDIEAIVEAIDRKPVPNFNLSDKGVYTITEKQRAKNKRLRSRL